MCTRLQRFRAKWRGLLEARYGGRCQWVTYRRTKTLEFAHLQPTTCTGRGRGMTERLQDVREHPECYALLCRRHHRLLDAGKVTLQLKEVL